MKYMNRKLFLPCALISTIGLFISCSRGNVQLDKSWSPPITVTASKSGLVDAVELYKWHDSIIMMQWQDDKSSRCFLMNRNGNSWSEAPLTGVPHGYIWAYPAIDQTSDRVFFEQGYMENDQLVMKVLVGRMSGNIEVRDVMERKWLMDKKTLFGETGSNVRLNDLGKRNWPY
jgi:hypothetical protein